MTPASFSRNVICTLFFLLNSSHVFAQSASTTDEKLEALKNEVVEAGINKLVNANTGASADLQGIATSLNDLIPDFKLSINGDEVGDDSLNSIGLTYSPRINSVADVGLSLVIDTPSVYGAFEEEGLLTPAQANAVGEPLSFGDSTEVKLTFSWLGSVFGRRYGRSLGDYQDVMDTLLDISIAANSERNANRQNLQDAQAGILSRLRAQCPVVRTQLTAAAQTGDPSRSDLEQALQRAIGAELNTNTGADAAQCEQIGREFIDNYLEVEQASEVYVAHLESMLTRMGLFTMPDLVEQQPQLQFAASYKDQDELAGPNETAISATWEIPLGENSVNRLISSDAWAACRNAATRNSAACVGELEGALGTSLMQETHRKSQFRFALSAEYRKRDDYSVMLADPALMYDLDGENATSVAGSLFLKRYMSENDNEPYVFEATLELESNDSEVRNDRTLFGLTTSRNISDGLALSVGLVWANRAEFRGEVDNELTARLGFNYKLTPR